MSHEPGPARALLFVADLTSRAEFLAAFGPFATARGILLVTHRSELPETGDRLVFRLALADGETMLAGEAMVTGNRGVGRRGVVRLEPTRLDVGSRVTHAALLERARPARGRDLMGDAIERLAECQVLEEAQATGEVDSGDTPVEPDPGPAEPVVIAADPPPRRRAHTAILFSFVAALLLLAPSRDPDPDPDTDPPSVSDPDPDPHPGSVSDTDPASVSDTDADCHLAAFWFPKPTCRFAPSSSNSPPPAADRNLRD